jgi:hypothetical protein
LNFSVETADVVTFAASPLLSFKLKLRNDTTERIQSIALRCQIQFETTKRRYSDTEKNHLLELFGEPERWGRTLRPMLWTHANVMVPPFEVETTVDLPVPCTFDFNVAATKYFAALEDGVVPLVLMFSGSVFFDGPDGELQVEQIPWDREALFQMPISTWQKMMDHYYPNCAWITLRRDVFDQLLRYKRERGIPTWEQVFETLIPAPFDAPDDKIAMEGSLPS